MNHTYATHRSATTTLAYAQCHPVGNSINPKDIDNCATA